MTNYNFFVIFSFFGVLFYFVSPDSVNGTVNIESLQNSRVFETSSTTHAGATICDCGHFTRYCSYTLEGKSCICYKGYAQTNVTKTGVCKECRCDANSVSCEFENNIKKCKCAPGYVEKYGLCQECDCGPNSRTCKLSTFGHKQCTCEKGYRVEKSPFGGDEFCKTCDCGQFTRDCLYTFMGKSCTCYTGYAQTNVTLTGVCKECSCGVDAVSCEYENNIKKCKCIAGYVEKYGSCQECDCGPNSRTCKRNSIGDKKCTCEEGYAVARGMFGGDESCKKCDCGLGANSCSIDKFGFRKCTCANGYVLPDKFSDLGDDSCKRCDCGLGAISCKIYSSGSKICNCQYGYEDIHGTCASKGSKIRITGISGWKIGTIALSVIYSGIIIALLYKIVTKRGNSVLQ